MEPVLEELTRAIEVINTLAVAVAKGQAVTGVGSKESFHRDSMATLLRVWMNGLSHLRPMVLSMAGTQQIPCSEQSHTSRSYIHSVCRAHRWQGWRLTDPLKALLLQCFKPNMQSAPHLSSLHCHITTSLQLQMS